MSLTYFLSRDSQGRLRSMEPHSRAALYELIGNLVTPYSGMPRDTEKPHRMPNRDVIQCPWHCCTKGDIVLTAWWAFRAAWLSEQILAYLSGLFCAVGTRPLCWDVPLLLLRAFMTCKETFILFFFFFFYHMENSCYWRSVKILRVWTVEAVIFKRNLAV